jgi:tetratricopeptide (TPR) repeat protein
LRPDYIKALNNLGAVYNKLGQYQEAVEVLLLVTKAKPDFAEAQYNLGTAYYNLGRSTRLLGHSNRQLRSRPTILKHTIVSVLRYIALNNSIGQLKHTSTRLL